MGKTTMANHYQIEARKLLVLQHLFNGVYEREIEDPNDELERPIENPTCSDYFRLVSKDKIADDPNYGSKPKPEFIRFNDVSGVLYRVNKKIREYSEMGVRMPDIDYSVLKEVGYSTISKGLEAFCNKDHILKSKETGGVKNKRFYFPDETIEGFNHLLDYVTSLNFSPKDPYGDLCHRLVYSRYSAIALNREFVIQNMRKKGVRPHPLEPYPYLGHYKKVFECPKPFEKLVEICKGLENSIPDDDRRSLYTMGSSRSHLVDIRRKAESYLGQIKEIEIAISESDYSEDMLARLRPEKWFELDPDSVLRREAKWTGLVLSERDLETLKEIQVKQYRKFGSEGPSDEAFQEFVRKYTDDVEINVMYALAMISNSYWSLIYFHYYNSDNFYKMMKGGKDPYEKLPGPALITGSEIGQDLFWEMRMYRYALYDYALGTTGKNRNGPQLMGIGPIEYDKTTIPTAFSFSLGPESVLTALWQPDRNAYRGSMEGKYHSLSTFKYVEKYIYGKFRKQSILPVLFEHLDSSKPIDQVILALMNDIDSDGNCEHGSDYYLEMFEELKH